MWHTASNCWGLRVNPGFPIRESPFKVESANVFSLIFDDTEMKRPYTKQLYELIYKQMRIKPDPQVFLGMVARAQTVDTRPFFFFLSGLGTNEASV